MIDAEALIRDEPQFRPILVTGDINLLDSVRSNWQSANVSSYAIRGVETRSSDDLFAEFQSVLAFPSYFGRNWDALDECLTDLSWLEIGTAIVLIFTDPAEVLRKSGGEEMRKLVDLLRRAASEWRRPVEDGEWWDRAPLPFRVVLISAPEDVDAARAWWSEAGVPIFDGGEIG